MTADIHQLPEPMSALAERIRTAHDRAERGKMEWAEGRADEAYALAEARARFPKDNNSFSIWLAENGLNFYGHHDQPAMIHLAQHFPTRADLVHVFNLCAEDQSRPSTIWSTVKRVEFAVSTLNKTSEKGSPVTGEPPPDSTPKAEVTVFPSPQPSTAPSDTGIVPTTEAGPPKLNKQHAFHDLPRGAEIAKTFLRPDASARIGRVIKARHGKEIWNLILQCYDAGFLRDSTYAPGGTPNLSLMLLFPRTPVSYAKRYMVTDQKDRDTIRERIIPAAMAHRDELLAAPDKLEQIVQKYERANREQAVAKVREQRLATARQNLDPTQPEVILYGHHFWPILDIDDPDQRYDYATLTAAAWFFADALSLAMAKTEDNSPRSCGMKIRFLVKRFSLFNKTTDPHDPVRARWLKLFSLVHEMTRLLEKHGHDAATGNRMPFLPNED